MGTGIERDLAALERGDLSREALETMHGRAVGPIVDAYERLRSVGSVPVGDADAGWARLCVHLDAEPVTGSGSEFGSSDRRGARRAEGLRRSVRSKRTVVLFLAATLMLGGSAFASTGGFGLMNGDDARSVDPVADRGRSSGLDHDPDGTDQGERGGQGDDDHAHDDVSDGSASRDEDAEDNGDDEVDESDGRDGDESDGRDGDGSHGSDESGGDGEEGGESE